MGRKGRKKRRKRRFKRTAINRRQSKKKRQPRTFDDICRVNAKQLVCSDTRIIGMERMFRVAKFTFGYVVECKTDDRDLIERETLYSNDGKIWIILSRVREGPKHHNMKWYPRDTMFPVGSKVRL